MASRSCARRGALRASARNASESSRRRRARATATRRASASCMAYISSGLSMVDFLLDEASAGSGAFSPEAITERQALSQSGMVTLRLFAATMRRGSESAQKPKDFREAQFGFSTLTPARFLMVRTARREQRSRESPDFPARSAAYARFEHMGDLENCVIVENTAAGLSMPAGAHRLDLCQPRTSL